MDLLAVLWVWEESDWSVGAIGEKGYERWDCACVRSRGCYWGWWVEREGFWQYEKAGELNGCYEWIIKL